MQTFFSKFRFVLLAMCLQLSFVAASNAQCNVVLVGSAQSTAYNWSFAVADSFNCLQPAVQYTYNWNFGDNSMPVTGLNPFATHTFNTNGNFNVCVTVYGGGLQISKCMSVSIGVSPQNVWIGGMILTAPNTCYNAPTTVDIFGLTNSSHQTMVVTNPIDSCLYFFNVAPNEQYLIVVTPDPSSGYLPTYYGNQVFWSEATLVTPTTGQGIWDLNVTLQTNLWSTIGTGNGILSGNVSGTGTQIQTNYNGTTLNTTFDAQRSHAIILNSANQPIGFANVDANGNFSFPNLPIGNYFLRIESPKINSSTFAVNVSVLQPNPTVSVTATLTGINLVTGNAKLVKANEMNVVPNPASNNIMVTGVTGKISIINAQGRVVMESNDSQLNIQSLSGGLYTIKAMNSAKEIITTRFIKN